MSTGSHYSHLSRPCWYCVHWNGPAWGDPYMAACNHGGIKSCKADAANGCVHWMRETGVDDDAWSPPAQVLPTTPECRPFEMTPELLKLTRKIQAELDARTDTRHR